MSIAHKLKDKVRTGDVLISEEIDFSSLLLSDCVIRGLQDCGFERPSPIQLKAIPLGRCGLDLIVQAKSGTGKTCVFSVIALESIQVQSSAIQVLVLAPTREIAIQIWEVIKSIGGAMPALRCHTFIGGLPLSEDKQNLKKCHIAVGSPGRIKQLIENGVLKTDSIRLFVLDEADKLLEESFQEQINWIYSALPDNKQMLALSATYPEYLAQHLTRYMRNPTFMRLNITDPALLGIRQYYKSVEFSPMVNVTFERKTAAVVDLLSGVSFQQCLIFSNLQTRAQNLSEELQRRGWPTACIAGCLDQRDRIEAMSRLKSYKCRILISTDLTSRGIDADKVNLVINLDVPQDHETYLHRIGRAGRFGSFGGAVSVVSSGKEEVELRAVERKCNTHIVQLPDPLPVDLLKTTAMVKLDDVVSTEQLITRTPDSHDLIAANQSSETSVSRQNLAEVSAGNDDHQLAEMRNGEDKSSGKEGQISSGQARHSNGFPQNGMGQQKTQDEDLHNGLLQLNVNGSDEQHENISGRDKLKSEIQELSVGRQSEAGVSESMMCKLEDKIIRATPEEEQDKTVGNGHRPIAKAKRKRKAEDRPKAHQPECSSKEIPTGVEVPVCVEMHRGGETASSRLASDLADRVKARQQSRPELTLPGIRDRLGCSVLQRPYSYTSALVDYERFLEEASCREDQIETGQLIMDKIDLERKASVDKELIASVNDCIDKMYACVLAANTQVDCCDVKDETKSPIEEPTLPVSGLCVQKCSKSTQTSHQTRTNNSPRAVRYHPMSVSSLGLCIQGQDTQLESKSNLHYEISNWTHSDILDKEPKRESCVEDTSTDQNIAISTVVEECKTGNPAGRKDTSDRLVESPVESVLNCDPVRQDCELMYVSDRVGTVSLTPHTVTVEPGLLHSLDVRPKSRKGKHTADLHGFEYGRIHGKNNPRTDYKLNRSEEYDTSSSESESSSSSEYEKEVFCNNYFEEPMGNRRKKTPKTEYKRHTKSSKNCSNKENIYDSSSRSEPYNQWYGWYNSPGAETLNYPPWYAAPSGYYPPYSYMYPHPTTHYPPHPYWHPQASSYGVGQCWGEGSGGERERVKAMRRTMELQRLYIRNMAKSTS